MNIAKKYSNILHTNHLRSLATLWLCIAAWLEFVRSLGYGSEQGKAASINNTLKKTERKQILLKDMEEVDF